MTYTTAKHSRSVGLYFSSGVVSVRDQKPTDRSLESGLRWNKENLIWYALASV